MTPKLWQIREVAQGDIDEQATYFGLKNDVLMIDFLMALEESLEMLVKSPGLGNANRLRHLSEAGVRIWPIKDFPSLLIFYREIPGGIEVIRVLHSRRNWPAFIG